MFAFPFKTILDHVAHADLERTILSISSTGITGVCHHAHLLVFKSAETIFLVMATKLTALRIYYISIKTIKSEADPQRFHVSLLWLRRVLLLRSMPAARTQ